MVPRRESFVFFGFRFLGAPRLVFFALFSSGFLLAAFPLSAFPFCFPFRFVFFFRLGDFFRTSLRSFPLASVTGPATVAWGSVPSATLLTSVGPWGSLALDVRASPCSFLLVPVTGPVTATVGRCRRRLGLQR